MKADDFSRGPLWIAWLATGAVPILAVLPRVISESAPYDPGVALTSLTVIGLVWYTYFTRAALYQAREQARLVRDTALLELARYRESLATAILGELRTLLPRLRTLAEGSAPVFETPSDFFDHPMLINASVKPELFDKRTIHAITLAVIDIRDLQTTLSTIPAAKTAKAAATSGKDLQRANEKLSQLREAAEIRSAWAYNETALVVPRLLSEGGLIPEPSKSMPMPTGERPTLAADPLGQ